MGLRNFKERNVQGKNAERQSRVAPRDSTKNRTNGAAPSDTDEEGKNNRAKILKVAVSEAG